MWFANSTGDFITMCLLDQMMPLISVLSIRTLFHHFLFSILFVILPSIPHKAQTHLLLSASDGSFPPSLLPYLFGLAAIEISRRAIDSFHGDDVAHEPLSQLASVPQGHATRRGQLQLVRPSSKQKGQYGAHPADRTADMPRLSAGPVLLAGMRHPTLLIGGQRWCYLYRQNEQGKKDPEAI
ncbi:MAG: hypothetical protein U1A78_00245 [Polyangia bacterium]